MKLWQPLTEYEVFPLPGKIAEKDRRPYEDLWKRMVDLLLHENTLLNTRMQAFLVATAFLMAAVSQFRERHHLPIATLICVAGVALAGVALVVLKRTARTIEWHLDALTRLDRLLYPADQRVFASRQRHLGELQTRGTPEKCPVSVILGVWLPVGLIIVWVGILAALFWIHQW